MRTSHLIGAACAGVLALGLSHSVPAAILYLQDDVSACESTDVVACTPDSTFLSGATMLSDSKTLTRNDQLDHNANVSIASVDYGLFHAAVSADISGNLTAGGSSSAHVFGRSDDQITINPQNPALIGTLGTMTFLVEVSGALTATESSSSDANAVALWSMAAFTDFGNTAFVSAQLGTTPYYETYGDASGGIYALTLPATLGSPQALILTYEVLSQAAKNVVATPASASASAQFGNTFRWLGIQSVMDETGTAIAFNVSSDSGVNWAQAVSAVPVPAAAWLFGTGLLGLIGISRRKNAE
jgi:hypothetical protein